MMNCPKCGREMEAGYLQSDIKVGITWVNKPMPLGLGWWKKDAVTVSDEIALGLSGVPTHICKSCNTGDGVITQGTELCVEH